MKLKSNLVFFFLVLFFVFYVALYIFLSENIGLWINDIKACYSVMSMNDFIFNHFHIFVYLLLFLFMTFSFFRVSHTILKTAGDLIDLRKYVHRTKLKSFKNLIIIDTDIPVSFNVFNTVVISKSVLNILNRNEKKAIFYHEIGHLNNYDSLKFLISDIILSIFPRSLENFLKKQLIIFSEFSADMYAMQKVSNTDLFSAVLKIKEEKNRHPQAATFLEERFMFVFENKKQRINPFILIIQLVPAVILIGVVIYKTCFCGAM